MDISEYAAWFHDGSLIEIFHSKNKIELSLESAELTYEDVPKGITLSKHSTIKGKLHLDGVKKITVDDSLFEGILKKEYDGGGIFDLEIKDDNVEISIKWSNYPPKPRVTDFSTITINAENIWWENIPDLESL